MKKSLFFLTLVLGLASFSFTIVENNQPKPWAVPDNFKKMKNPVASDATTIADGKALWNTHCKSCHGAKGLGDGSKAAQLKTEPGDFSKADVQSQADGVLFYKLSEGRDDMPSFKKKLPEADERWSLVNFIRSLKK
jgi:mono/diheme cytochrome c family protein